MMASCSRPPKKVQQEITNGPNWLELPRDVTTNILQRLGVDEIMMTASQVCSLWWNICKDPLMWRFIDMTKFPAYYPNSKLVKICQCVVDRSCGYLEEIRIEYFATNDLLKYIADRACHLRRLRIPFAKVSDEVMRVVVKKFPVLEELEISFNHVSKDSLEVIGICCPLLKTLKFCTYPFHTMRFAVCDENAFAIAKTMPELRHLHISGLSNEGLLAILDGCPLLEYLDLRDCFLVDLRGSLGKRLFEQIKEIQLPHYSQEDDEEAFYFSSEFDCENFGFDNYFD